MNPPQNRPATDNSPGINWKTLPWALMVLGCLLLASQFLNSGQGQQTALSWYANSGLQQLEWNNYLSWLRFNGNARQAKTLDEQARSGNPHAYASALLSPQFIEDSNKRAGDFWSAQQIEQWRTLRDQVPQQLAQSPLYRWGLPAADPRPSRFFTAPFTGGALWLTLLALFLLGLAALRLERQLGPGRVVVIWLASSLLAGAGYLIMVTPGQAPLHGLAPSIVGLLAATGALSRTPVVFSLPTGKTKRTTQTLPAWSLVLLPITLLAALTLSQPPWVANLSAGLLAGLGGALLAILIQPRQNAAPETRQFGPSLSPDQQQALARGWDALGKLEGASAERHFQDALKTDPQLFDALTGLFTAQQMRQATEEDLQQTATALFSHNATDTGQATQIVHHWKQYKQSTAEPLPEATLWQLVITLTHAREFQHAEQLAMQHAANPAEKEHCKTALQILREALLREGLNHRAKALPD